MDDKYTTERTDVERQAARTYLREFLPAIIGYSLVLALIMVVVDFENAGAWKYAVALLPMIPAAWGAVAIGRHLRRVDELQRMVMVSGLSVGFGVAMVTAMTFGFLAMAGLDVGRVSPWIIYSAGLIGWMVGSGMASRRLG